MKRLGLATLLALSACIHGGPGTPNVETLATFEALRRCEREP